MHRREFLKYAAALSAGGLLSACSSAIVDPTQLSPVEHTSTPTPEMEGQAVQPIKRRVVILADGLEFPEGPAFDPQGGVWCTELGAGNLVRWQSGELTRYTTGGSPNGLAFDKQGRAWFPDSKQNAIRRYHPEAELWEVILDQIDGEPLLSPNDLSFDARGNLLFTCPNFGSEDALGYVVCLKPDKTALKVAEGYYRPNGLDIVDGGKSLVVADTFQRTLFKGAWDDQACSWTNVQPWALVGGSEGPDGMAFGADGMLYQAIYGDGVICVVDGQGEVTERIELPGKNPTNVAVDPGGKLGLVVTEAEKGLLLSIPEVAPGAAIFDGGEIW
jgi:gluconolactonase